MRRNGTVVEATDDAELDLAPYFVPVVVDSGQRVVEPVETRYSHGLVDYSSSSTDHVSPSVSDDDAYSTEFD